MPEYSREEERVPEKNPTLWIRTFLYGVCMGAADIVPGISGGTVAFIMGFYEDLIFSIKSLGESLAAFLGIHRPVLTDKSPGRFLLVLGLGVVCSIITLASFIHYILNDESYRTLLYSTFFGFICASAVFCGKQLGIWRLSHFIAFALSAVLAWEITGLDLNPSKEGPLYDVVITPKVQVHKKVVNYDHDSGTLLGVSQDTVAAMVAKGVIGPNAIVKNAVSGEKRMARDFASDGGRKLLDPWIFLCGAIAVCAMLLPGISGSYLLNILGVYPIVIGALADLVKSLSSDVNRDALMIILNLLAGVLIGAICFSQVIAWGLKRYHDIAISLLTGFMVGALRSVWPYWSYFYVIRPLRIEDGAVLQTENPILPGFSSPIFLVSLAFALGGFLLVLSLEYFAEHKTK